MCFIYILVRYLINFSFIIFSSRLLPAQFHFWLDFLILGAHSLAPLALFMFSISGLFFALHTYVCACRTLNFSTDYTVCRLCLYII